MPPDTPPPTPRPSLARYVGVVDAQSGKGSVELRRYPKSHPFAQLQVGQAGAAAVQCSAAPARRPEP